MRPIFINRVNHLITLITIRGKPVDIDQCGKEHEIRILFDRIPKPNVLGIRSHVKIPREAVNIPNKVPGVLYIVSNTVLRWYPRDDFVAPDTTKAANRNNYGYIVSVDALNIADPIHKNWTPLTVA